MKSNSINRILINKSKIKLCVGIIVGITILTGCKINSNNIPESVSVESKHETICYDVEINFSNTDLLTEDDRIYFVDEEGCLLNYVKSDRDIWNTKIIGGHNNVSVISNALKQEKLLPEIGSNEKYIINIDYDEKTLNIEIEE